MIKNKIFLRKCKRQKCILMNNENRNHMPQEKEISIDKKIIFSDLNIMQDFRTNFWKKK